MNEPSTVADALEHLGPSSYSAQRLQHATPEHLHITTRRCFVGPIPQGWLKSHRRDWYKRHLHIHYSSRAATFAADPTFGKHRRMTGIDGPSASAAHSLSFPQPNDLTDEELEQEEDDENDDGRNTSGSRTVEARSFYTALSSKDTARPLEQPPALTDTNAVFSGTLSEAAAPAWPSSSNRTDEVEDHNDTSSHHDPTESEQSRPKDIYPASPGRSRQESASSFVTADESISRSANSARTVSSRASSSSSAETIRPVRLDEAPNQHASANQSVESEEHVPSPSTPKATHSDQNNAQNGTTMSAPQVSASSRSLLQPDSARSTPQRSSGLFSQPTETDHTYDQIHSSTSSLLRQGASPDLPASNVSTANVIAGSHPERDKSDLQLTPRQLDGGIGGETGPQAKSGPGLVRFNVPGDENQNEREVRVKLAQMRKRDTIKRFRKGNVVDGQIIKAENMLVRVESTTHDLPKDFNENDSQKIESRTVSKWREYMVACRETVDEDSPFILQMYKTRVIAAVEKSRSRKRSAHQINLRRGHSRINLFSSLDKTMVIWVPTPKGNVLYLMQAKSGASSMEWYTFLRNVLGKQRSSFLNLHVPDLDLNLRLGDPFAALESTRDLVQAAEGNEDAINRTMKEERAVAANILTRCIDILKKNPEWADIVRSWTEHEKIGLAWKRYDRLEWIHGANEQKMYGTIGMEKTHELEIRLKQHYPTETHVSTGDMSEPVPVEGFLVRLTSQRGVDQKFGRTFFKRHYFSTHNQYLVFTKPAKADPPPPPKFNVSVESDIPSTQQITDKTPLIYSVTPFPVSANKISWLQKADFDRADVERHDRDAYDESERNFSVLLECDGVIDLSHVTEVRSVKKHLAAPDDSSDEENHDEASHVNTDTQQDSGIATNVDAETTFELVLQNGLIIRLSAFDKKTRQEWTNRLSELVKYWTSRVATDMALFKEVREQNLERLKIDQDAEALVGQFAQKWEVKNAYASPQLHNMCGISCCRSIHLSGTLFRKPRMRGHFQRNLVILSHGKLIYFQDSLRRSDGKLLKHTHHDRTGSLDLKDCYIYSGLITANDLLYTSHNFDSSHPGQYALPRMYVDDNWQSTDDDSMTCFVIWHGKRRSWFKANQAERSGRSSKTKLKMVTRLGAEGKSVVFKARSRAERDRWVLAIGMEIERLSQDDQVRIVEEH